MKHVVWTHDPGEYNHHREEPREGRVVHSA